MKVALHSPRQTIKAPAGVALRERAPCSRGLGRSLLRMPSWRFLGPPQIPRSRCVLCADAPNEFAHFVVCGAAVGPFCSSLGVPVAESVRQVFEHDLVRALRIRGATFIEFAGIVVASRDEVAARGQHFVPNAAATAVRALAPPSVAIAKAGARRRRPLADRAAPLARGPFFSVMFASCSRSRVLAKEAAAFAQHDIFSERIDVA